MFWILIWWSAAQRSVRTKELTEDVVAVEGASQDRLRIAAKVSRVLGVGVVVQAQK